MYSVHPVHPDIDTTYSILRKWAREKQPRTYADLSHEYESRTDVRLPPHETWDATLGDINRRLDKAGLPPLSGLVVLQSDRRTGAGFWGSCSRTSGPLPTRAARDAEYFVILNEIFAATWPAILP